MRPIFSVTREISLPVSTIALTHPGSLVDAGHAEIRVFERSAAPDVVPGLLGQGVQPLPPVGALLLLPVLLLFLVYSHSG